MHKTGLDRVGALPFPFPRRQLELEHPEIRDTTTRCRAIDIHNAELDQVDTFPCLFPTTARLQLAPPGRRGKTRSRIYR
jgi:hypothetical protein